MVIKKKKRKMMTKRVNNLKMIKRTNKTSRKQIRVKIRLKKKKMKSLNKIQLLEWLETKGMINLLIIINRLPNNINNKNRQRITEIYLKEESLKELWREQNTKESISIRDLSE